MRQLVVGNWKMNGLGSTAVALIEVVRDGTRNLDCDVAICPPATLTSTAARLLEGTDVGLGGQDCHCEPAGAHTGDISAPMLKDAGASWVILGHSERRADHHETDAMVRAKVLAAEAAGLTPIVCVGETEEQRLAGQATQVVGSQLGGSLPGDFAGVVAYEPVWAIGTGRTPTEADVAAMHGFIRSELGRRFGEPGKGIRILYGGSVKSTNATALLSVPEVGGALVGGASLDAAAFLGIARASDALSKAAQGG
jgi:triosephosphate isomerase